jgi:transposase-like protein
MHPLIARLGARHGMSDGEIAREMGISRGQLRMWTAEHPEFAAAIAEGRDMADARVADALYRRAIGFNYTQTEIMKDGTKDRAKKITRYLPPDPQAAMFWLKNRRPDVWRHKQAPPKDEVVNIRFRPPWGGNVRKPEPPNAA